jgi:hypothetical protein
VKVLRSLSRDQRIRDSLNGKTYYEGSLLKAIGSWDFKNQTSYRGKLLIRVLLYLQSLPVQQLQVTEKYLIHNLLCACLLHRRTVLHVL